MSDSWKWLKRIGRRWCLLTHEDRDADPATIREILIVVTAGDLHAEKAAARAQERFPHAIIRTIGGEPYLWRMLRALRRWRGEQLSAVVLLSLNPPLVASTCLWFPCYKLLYNRWGEWYLIRRKTAREWLVGRRGADDRTYDWPPDGRRLRWGTAAAKVVMTAPRFLYQGGRALRLACWVLWRIGFMLVGRLTGGIHEPRVTSHMSRGASR